MNKVFLGKVGVDSGNLLLIDPCYVKDNKELHNEKNFDQYVEKKIIGEMIKNNQKSMKLDLGLMFGTGGDGYFSVYGFYQDNDIKKLEVILENEIVEGLIKHD